MRRRGLYKSKSGGAVAIPTENLVLYCGFNNSLTDETGNHTLTNSGVTYVNGLWSGTTLSAANWAQAVDYVTIPDSDLFSFGNGTTDSPFSISFGVFFSGNGDNSTSNTIINKRGDDGTGSGAIYREWQVVRAVPSQKLRVILWDDSASANFNCEADTVLSNSTNYHITVTYDGSSTFAGIKIYIDGVLESTYNDNSTGTYTAMENLSAPVAIGGIGWSFDSTTAYFNGLLDGLGIWDVELSQAEVAAIYSKQTGGTEIL